MRSLINVSHPSRWEKRHLLFIIPILSLLLAYFASSFIYSEFIVSDLEKTLLPTGLKPAEVMIGPSNHLTEAETAVINNKAYAARSSWTAFAYLHLTVCVIALITGIYLIFAAARGFSYWLPGTILIVYFGCILYQIATRNLSGNYRVFTQLVQQTIAVAENSGFPKILLYSILLNKVSFFTATLLAIAGGMTLLERPSNHNNLKAKHLRDQMRLQQITLYIGTIVLVSSILLWSFALRWALVYIYPWDGPIYQSIESLTNSQITIIGIYYSILLGVAYIPIAVIHHQRALKLVEQEKPQDSIDKQSTWLKENGLSTSPMELLPRIVAILGPVLAGSITDLIRVVQ